MARPFDLPAAERYAHGTCARYVSGCRCDLCRTASRRRQAERAQRVREAAAEAEPNPGPPLFKPISRRSHGRWIVIDARVCPGTDGQPCVAGGAWLKPPWPWPVCRSCVDRAAVWNGLVDAAPVRAHLKRLQRAGVGHKSVAAACDVGKTLLAEILWGGKKTIRKRAADRVLAVTKDAVADGGRVPAGPTWKLVDEIVAAGLSKMKIAKDIGQHGPALQLSRHKVLASTALAVRRLHARVMADGERGQFPRDETDPRYIRADVLAVVLQELRDVGLSSRAIARHLGYQIVKPRCTPGTLRKLRELLDRVKRQAEVDERAERLRRIEEGQAAPVERVCPDCGASHAPEARRARLTRLLPASAEAIRDALSCFYGAGSHAAGERALYRDLKALAAVDVGGTWALRGAEAAA